MPSHSGCSSPSSFTCVEAIPASASRAAPWKNGGGLTREIGVHPAGASLESFAWRISAADVARAGPFSSYRHIDRTIVLTHGRSMTLIDTASQARHHLKRWEPYRFDGEASIQAELPDGPTRDFNLMVRRGAGVGRLTVLAAAQTLILEPGHSYLHCAAGSFGVAPADGKWPHMHDRHAPFTPSAPSERTGAHPVLAPHIQSAHALETGDTLHLTIAPGSSLRLIVAPLTTDARLIDVQANTISGASQ